MPLATARRHGLPLEVEAGHDPTEALRRLRGAPVASVALRGRAAAVRGKEAASLAGALGAAKLVLPVSCFPANATLESIVSMAVELDAAARDVGARVCIETPLRRPAGGSMA